MSMSANLYASEQIEQEALEGLILQCGGETKYSPYEVGRVSRHDQHIWIFMSNEELDSLEEDKEKGKIISSLLGSPPCTLIPIDISRTLGSQQICIDFALAFMQRWKAVLSDPEDNILSQEQVAALHERGKGFYPD